MNAGRGEIGRAAVLFGAAFALTVVAPLWLLLLAPLVLGVPHLAADVRYLVLGPPGGVARGVALAVAAPLAAMTALRLLALAGGPSFAAVEVALGGAAIAGAVLAGGGAHAIAGATLGRDVGRSLSRGAAARAAVALSLVALVVALGCAAPSRVVLWLAHLHNLVALGLWLRWSRAPARRRLAVALSAAAGAAAIAWGAFDRVSLAAGAFAAPSSGLDFAGLTETLAPGLPATAALRVVLLYAFAQALHYAAWLAMIPAAANRRTSWRADFGALPLAIALGAAVALPAAALFAPARARAAYLSLVLFHGWLELAVIAHLAVRRRSAAPAGSATSESSGLRRAA